MKSGLGMLVQGRLSDQIEERREGNLSVMNFHVPTRGLKDSAPQSKSKGVSRALARVAAPRSPGSQRGVVSLTSDEYSRFEKCMTNPAKPTKALLEGAALLRNLSKKSR